jgi:serine/threonine protein kinase
VTFARERAEAAPYEALCEIASGGMGVVELVVRREGSFRRLFARKRLHPLLRVDRDVRSMFVDEARIAGLLQHQNVVSVLDVGEDADGPYLVMDFVDGVSLAAIGGRFEDRGIEIPLDVCMRIVAECARGLHAAHELRGHDGTWLELVHRDVSPHNVLIGFDGSVRLTDFGIAKAVGRATRTSAGLLKGKLGYLAPEQLRFEEPDRRSDIFALGVVLFELASGRRLYRGESLSEVARKVLNEDPPDLLEKRDVPPELAALARSMLSRKREGRPASALIVADRLERLLRQTGSTGDVRAFMREHFERERAESESRIARTLGIVDRPEHPTLKAAPMTALSLGLRPGSITAAPLGRRAPVAAFEPEPDTVVRLRRREQGTRTELADPPSDARALMLEETTARDPAPAAAAVAASERPTRGAERASRRRRVGWAGVLAAIALAVGTAIAIALSIPAPAAEDVATTTPPLASDPADPPAEPAPAVAAGDPTEAAATEEAEGTDPAAQQARSRLGKQRRRAPARTRDPMGRWSW